MSENHGPSLTGESDPFVPSSFEVTDDPIWRYTTLAKLVNILRMGDSVGKGKLVFGRSDVFNDEYEGTLPTPNQSFQRHIWDNLISDITQIKINLEDNGTKVIDPSIEHVDQLMEADKKLVVSQSGLEFAPGAFN
ncbi:hypothetical protein [Haloferax sp. Q22]|uniref:hypothetical protein n=1 Tax=Haloferax sp. (strain Q22) TaxID=1526048 RepID=UPI0012F8332E|nr:hypothetical protein [Haloferax sp. Q22]